MLTEISRATKWRGTIHATGNSVDDLKDIARSISHLSLFRFVIRLCRETFRFDTSSNYSFVYSRDESFGT